MDVQIISVIGRARYVGGAYLSEDDIVDYYVAVGRTVASIAHHLPKLRWKFNRYQFNRSMHDFQSDLKIDRAAFERIVGRIKAKFQGLFPTKASLVNSHREDYGYLFIRSDGTILTIKGDGDEEVYVELGSFLTGSIRHPEVWQQIRSRMIRHTMSLEREDMLILAVYQELGITSETPLEESARRLSRLSHLIKGAIASGNTPIEFQSTAFVDAFSLKVITEEEQRIRDILTE